MTKLYELRGHSVNNGNVTRRIRAESLSEAKAMVAKYMIVRDAVLIETPPTWNAESARRRVGGTFGS